MYILSELRRKNHHSICWVPKRGRHCFDLHTQLSCVMVPFSIWTSTHSPITDAFQRRKGQQVHSSSVMGMYKSPRSLRFWLNDEFLVKYREMYARTGSFPVLVRVVVSRTSQASSCAVTRNYFQTYPRHARLLTTWSFQAFPHLCKGTLININIYAIVWRRSLNPLVFYNMGSLRVEYCHSIYFCDPLIKSVFFLSTPVI